MRLPFLIVACLAFGCEGSISELQGPGEVGEPTTPENVSEVVRESVGSATIPPGRSLRRMSADQFQASLTMVTGQVWEEYEEYASALGRADFAEITTEGDALNVTFEKFIGDAARATCRAAVESDVAGAEPPAILRFASAADRDQGLLRTNVEYLLLRFLGEGDFTPDDPRVAIWMDVLNAPEDEVDGVVPETTDEVMERRWMGVCIGLVTHPDFVTY